MGSLHTAAANSGSAECHCLHLPLRAVVWGIDCSSTSFPFLSDQRCPSTRSPLARAPGQALPACGTRRSMSQQELAPHRAPHQGCSALCLPLPLGLEQTALHGCTLPPTAGARLSGSPGLLSASPCSWLLFLLPLRPSRTISALCPSPRREVSQCQPGAVTVLTPPGDTEAGRDVRGRLGLHWGLHLCQDEDPAGSCCWAELWLPQPALM